MSKTREDFELETGLFDDLDGVIANVFFGPPSGDYSALSGTADAGLYLVIETPDLEKPMEQFYSLGAKKAWKVTDNGEAVVSEAKPDSHAFNTSSRGGALVQRMMSLIGNGDMDKGKEFFIARDCYMTQKGFYTGLNFHWKREPLKTVGGESRDVLLPNKYLGEVKTAAGAKGPTGTGTTSTPSGDATVLDNIVIGLAEGKTERELKQAALKNDALKANSAYMKDLISGAILKKLETDGKLSKGPENKYV